MPRANVLLAHADERDLSQLDEYRAVGGYDALERALAMDSDALIDAIVTSTLRGRGGAGFPTGRKASLVDRSGARPSYLVINADESEPGAFKDREIIRRNPHLLIEGCLIAARAILSKHVFIYIRGEYLTEWEVLQGAVDDARAAGLFGDVEITVHRGAGAYICGEETALLDSLEGRRGQPRPRPPFPPIQGLYMSPTQINNVQTIATVPVIIAMGAEEFAKIGPENSPGTAIFSLSGNVVNPGNYELELGSTLRELIYDVGGGVPDGHAIKAIIPGGSSVPVLTPDQLDTPMDYDSIAAAGSFFGSAAVMVIDERCCMVQLALRAEKFYMHESCGKCTPCREGTRWLVQLLQKIEDGRGEYSDLDLIESVGSRILGRSLCALGDFAVYPVQSYLRKFRSEFEAHIEGGGCPFGGESSIEGIVAPVDQHTHHPVATVPAMSAQELLTVTVDDVEVQVPKGTGVVETALAAGIEIPVFCYEPRLGAPVGACRMCLCEVEGMPKLQTACTMTATDGMVVRSALTSPKAAEAQNSTLEFILVNHPLDCPVCDKGGECPLQDLTFRYGPGSTRMYFPKRTFEKPIPISPTIALDRERCILCYRCTRFSENVSEDMQLVALNRGASSIIATFEDEPYVGAFSGNVIELCPVGALTSTQYRFEARPWEIQSVPSICGLCPVGCNIAATTREGKVKRILSRNHPEVDDGWLCDKGRFAFSHLKASDRITEPRRRVGAQAFEPASFDAALDEAERLLRRAGTHVVTALSGTETVEQAYALAKLLRRGLGAHAALLPETENARALDGFRRPLSSIREADVIAVLADEPVAESAPIVDLWIRAARRNGAEVLYELDEEKIRDASRAVLIGSGAHDSATLAANARRLGAWAAFYIPAAANARGVCEAWSAASDEEEPENPDPVRLLVISGDEALVNPNVRALATQAEHVLVVAMFERPARTLADLVLPGTSYLEREGTYVNLEGRLQRLRRAVVPPAPDELAWISGLAERFDVDVSPHAAGVFQELSALIYDGLAFSAVGEQAPLPERSVPEAEPAEVPAPKPAPKGLRLVAYRPLFSGPAIERVPELAFQRAQPVLEIGADDARARGITPGDEVDVRSNGTSARLRARISRTLPRGTVRAPAEHVAGLLHDVEVTRA